MLLVEGTEPGYNSAGEISLFVRAIEWPSLRPVRIEIVPEPAHWDRVPPMRRPPRRVQGRGMAVRRTKPREQRNARRKR